MIYTHQFLSPLGEMLMAGNEKGLTGLWFCGQKYFGLGLDPDHKEKALPVFQQAEQWLRIYFSGKEPDFSVPLHFSGTEFQKEVWKLLCDIPYGQTVTYGDLARSLLCKKEYPTCPLRLWAVLWGIIKFLFSFPVTGFLVPAAALPAMPEVWIKKESS